MDRFKVPAPLEIFKACRRTRRYCCESEKTCILYNQSFHLLKSFKGFGGVYIFSAGRFPEIRYIGQTNDFLTRIQQHNTPSLLLDKIRARENVAVLCETRLFEDPYEKFYWEQKWIAEYKPPYSNH